MKKLFSLLLTLAILAMGVCAMAEDLSAEELSELLCGDDSLVEIIEAAREEGELTVYGCCEEPYIAAATGRFQELTGITTHWQRLSTGEVQAKIAEENGNPSADIWFAGTSDPYNETSTTGLLTAYEAVNAKNLRDEMYRDPDGYWYGIYTGVMGFMVNNDELDRLGLEAPQDWDDLTKEEYKGLIWLSNPNTAGTAKVFINTLVQLKGHDAAMEYFVELDKNIAQYTKSGGGPSKNVGIGECVIAIGFLHDGVYQILQGYDNIGLIIPESGTGFEVGATAILEGCKHPNAAKLWIEFALSPECVELADDTGSYQFLVISNAEQPEAVTAFDINFDNVIDYDFEDAKANTTQYVNDFFNALGAAADDRFKTE